MKPPSQTVVLHFSVFDYPSQPHNNPTALDHYLYIVQHRCPTVFLAQTLIRDLSNPYLLGPLFELT